MSEYAKLFQIIQDSVLPAYQEKFANISSTSIHDVRDSAKIHAYLLLLLEITVYEYRKKHATPFEPLQGEKALKHLLFTCYRVPLSEVESVSLEWLVFALLKDLTPENLSESARNYVNGITLNKAATGIDWRLKINWTLGFGEVILEGAH
ncbi:ECs1072 family phage-associated protein [Arsenophonus nasoniae]|uniref:ECs1072 family phage-associated protein n=1 Tax=Arsenophonus nasoniae TaxID=638 RepID=UPI003CC81D54